MVPARDLAPGAESLADGIRSGFRRILLQVLPLAAVFCAIAVMLAYLFSRRLVGPVRALTVSAERLAQGHTDEPVPPQGADEVGMLSEALERMRREVNASRDGILAAARELEGRVADRTTQLRERNEELVALNDLAGSLTRSLDPPTLLGEAVATLRAFLPLTGARGYVLDAGSLRRLAEWTAGEGPPAADLDEVAAAAVGSRELVVRPGARTTLIGIPLATAEGALGAMAVLASGDWHVAGRTRGLIRAVADQVGLALRTAQLSAEGRELAVLEERTRLAREIHDTLAQQLTGIVLQLEAAEAFVGRDQDKAHSVVVAARDQARSALQEARRSVWNLRPAPLEATGLAAAVEREVKRWRERTGIGVVVRTRNLPSPLALAPQAEVALFRILQEALSNIAQHARATSVEVRLGHRAGVLELSVSDDGVGLSADSSGRVDAFGLVGMEERARLAGAELLLQRPDGGGTRVVVRLPLDEGMAVAAATA
ncbi:MAG: HAMP domain-containing protein [Chloroflexi bacterium]|nr:MAG: HAMP domain-containing protein [Chloroflexota bacterium]